MRVLALDPGLKTGVCLYDADEGKVDHFSIVPFGLEGFQSFWEAANYAGRYDVLVVESFEPEEGTHGIDYTPLEIIGYLKGLGIPIEWQRRNQRGKGKLISTAVLKRAGLYPPRGELKEGHQVEALRHALAYLVKIRHMDTIRLLHPKETP